MALTGARKVEVEPGVRLWVEDIGKGQPMVFLHGWPASHRMFESQFNELPKHGIRCIGIDTRGFGWSERPWDGYTYDRLADDVKAVLDAYDLNDVTLVGMSMGGAIALRTVTRHGGARIRQLALLGAAVPSLTRRPDFPYGIERSACDDLITLAYRDRPKMVKTFGDIFFHEPEALSPEYREWFQDLCEEASGRATIAACECFRDSDLRPDLAAVKVPTLILHGKEDKICPYALAEQTNAGIAGSRLVGVEGAGHGFCYEQRNLVNDELIRFAGAAAQAGRKAAKPAGVSP